MINNFKFKISNLKFTEKRGLLAISVVLLIASVLAATVIVVSRMSINEGQSGLALSGGEGSLQTVEGCVEDLLWQIHQNESYANASIIHLADICYFNYLTTNPWEVDVTALPSNSTLALYKRKVKVKFSRSASGVTLTSWQEI